MKREDASRFRFFSLLVLQSPWTCFVRFDSVRLQFFTRYIKLYLTSWYTLSSALHVTGSVSSTISLALFGWTLPASASASISCQERSYAIQSIKDIIIFI